VARELLVFSDTKFLIDILISFPQAITLSNPMTALLAYRRGHILTPEGIILGRDVTVSPEANATEVQPEDGDVEAMADTGLDAEMDVDHSPDDDTGIDVDEEVAASMGAEMDVSDEGVQLFSPEELAEMALMRELARERGESEDGSDVSEFDEEKAYGDLISTVVASSGPPVAGPSTQSVLTPIPTPRRRGGKGTSFLVSSAILY
jgi:hypothetical protein